MGRLEDKVALITGAARGTGEATATLFVEEGARVVLGDLRDDLGEQVAKRLGDHALYVHLDVTSESDWRRAVEATTRQFGSLDVLVNNAGVLHLAAIEDTELSEFERLVRINQIGPFLGIKSVLEPMKRAGGGSIVNISSVDGLVGMNGTVAYASTKWAVRGITKVAAIELGRFGIRVNAVCPEAGSGEMIAPFMPPGADFEALAAHGHRILASQKSRTNRDRVGDIARLIQFLASDESASCTGGDFAIDSGNTAGRRVRGAPGS